MMKLTRFLTVAAAVVAAVFALAEPVMAGADTFAARLRGYEEVPIISTAGQGFFVGNLNAAENSIDFTLVYFGLQGSVTQAHIHLGQTSVNGGIVLFLCTNLAPPAGVPVPSPCPASGGSVSGTLTAANVITVTAQGIGAGEFSEIVDSLRAGVGYANVHSDQFPGGEVRGQLTH